MNGEVFDLDRPLEGDCKLELLKFDDKEGILNKLFSIIMIKSMSPTKAISTKTNDH